MARLHPTWLLTWLPCPSACAPMCRMKGTQSPANYDHQQDASVTAFGRQSLSYKRSNGGPGFGSTPKLLFKVPDTPGPGTYD